MAAKKNSDETTQEQVPGAPTNADLGRDVGYIGTKVDPHDNSEYSLESGPDSPGAADTAVDVAESRLAALKNPDATANPNA